LNCARCWTREDFDAHVKLHSGNDTYFPDIPDVLLHQLPTAWTHHIHFAVWPPLATCKAVFTVEAHVHVQVWLVQAVTPDVIVDLGVDHGYSTFCFALPVIGHVYVRAVAVFYRFSLKHPSRS
jgi:hypothetical protein